MPTGRDVKDALVSMAMDTLTKYLKSYTKGKLKTYEPSEKYASVETIVLPLGDSLNARLRTICEAENIPSSGDAINEPDDIIFYYVSLRDSKGEQMMAFRRASHFRGTLASRRRLISWIDDSLRMMKENVFRLDEHFDFWVTGNTVYILHPSNFEFVAQIEQKVLDEASKNSLEAGKAALDFWDANRRS